MKLTNYEHACFTVEKDGQILVVDPGEFSNDFVAPENVTAVVYTHHHADHFDPQRLAEIFAKNDNVLVLGPADVIDKVELENKQAAKPGENVTVGPFDLEFFGGDHATIYPTLPTSQNLGVLINNLLYYPGDSFATPSGPVDTLALPVSAPWLKISETIDFLLAVKPRLVFPTHDAILSDAGKVVVDRVVTGFAANNDFSYTRLNAPIEL